MKENTAELKRLNDFLIGGPAAGGGGGPAVSAATASSAAGLVAVAASRAGSAWALAALGGINTGAASVAGAAAGAGAGAAGLVLVRVPPLPVWAIQPRHAINAARRCIKSCSPSFRKTRRRACLPMQRGSGSRRARRKNGRGSVFQLPMPSQGSIRSRQIHLIPVVRSACFSTLTIRCRAETLTMSIRRCRPLSETPTSPQATVAACAVEF